MMWGDIVLQHPDKIADLPDDIEMLNWCYGENPKEEAFQIFKNTGCKQIVCPGTGSWYRFVESIDASSKNICRMLDYGYKYGASGMLNTNWGDDGHPCSIELSMHGLVLGAAKSWNKVTDNDCDFNNAINFLLYKNSSAMYYISILDDVSKKIKYRDFIRLYSNIVCEEKLGFEYPTPEVINDAVSSCREVIEKLSAEKWEIDAYRREILICAEAIIVMSEIFAKFIGHEVERYSDTAAWLEKYRESWLASNKESELCEIEKMFVTLEAK